MELLAIDEKSTFDFFALFGKKNEARFIPQIKQKNRKWIIYEKLRVPSSEREGELSNPCARTTRASCMENIYGNLRKPPRACHARAMFFKFLCYPYVQYDATRCVIDLDLDLQL